MKKKLFTLLTLMLCVCSGAWAGDVSVTWTMGSNTTGSADPVTAATNIAFNLGSDLTNAGTKDYNNITFTSLQPVSSDKGNNGRSNLIANRYVDFTFTPVGGSFTPEKITFDCIKIGTGDPSIVVDFIDGAGNTIKVTNNDAAIRRNDTSTEPAIGHEYSVAGAASSENAVTLRIYVGKCANNKQVGIANVVISGTVISSDAPVFSSNIDAMALAVNPISTSKSATFTLSGKNLTDGTYNLTVPSVTGLSVTPTSFTVADGSCSQEFTVTYTSTTDVTEAVANITATVDDITATVAVTYSSVANLYTQTAITGPTTWDWSKYGVKEINTSGTAFNRTDVLVANVAFYGFDAPASAFGPAESLTLSGDYIVRDTKYCQITSAKFTTTVPGMLKVVFSNTGGDRPYRYLYVNGKDTGVGSNSGTMVTASNIFVPAGDVELTAIVDPDADESYNPGSSSFMRVSLIEFTALPETTSITINNGTGYRTFASKYPTNWANVEGVTAYIAKVADSKVSFEKVTGAVPAGEGLLLKGADGTYNVPIVGEAADVTNALIGVTKETVVNGAGIYVLLDGDSGVGFYMTTAESFTVGANTAYLPADLAGSRTFIGFDTETTGISEIAARENGQENVFNLQGVRVAQPTKGLYIVNGKKIIVK